MAMYPRRFAVVMAGGAGTRLWPLSRRRQPKQLIALAGRRTLLQETLARIRPLVPPRRTIVVTAREQVATVRKQLPQLPAANVITEPVGRNTAACIAVATEWVHHVDPDSSMAVFPADHWVEDQGAFCSALERAFAVAEGRQCLIALGIPATRPEVGYGYIRVGERLDGKRPPVYRIAGFREKPTHARARRFLQSGRYLWNAGIFVWRTDIIRSALSRYQPLLTRRLAGIGPALHGRHAARVLREPYRRLPSVSIDVGLMEPASRFHGDAPALAVVATECGWNDVGSLAMLGALWGQDRGGNAIRGKVILLDTRGSTVAGGQRAVALLGVRDLIVVDTPDALLVCRADRAHAVRGVVAEVARRRWHALL